MNPLLKNMNKCPKCDQMYPNRFDKCPMCHTDAVSEIKPLTAEQLERAIRHSIKRSDLDESQRK